MSKLLGGIFILLLSYSVNATLITSGSGAAVSNIDASANFEDVLALNSNPYSEDGLLFSRTGLSFNNNGCGYAGCTTHTPFDGFSGNYMYGVGNGYFQIETSDSSVFYGLEFIVGTGLGSLDINLSWETFLNGVQTDAGSFNSSAGSVVGFTDNVGFDSLRLSQNGFSSYGGTAFDSVKADLSVSVPEPTSIAILGLGLVVIGFSRKKKTS